MDHYEHYMRLRGCSPEFLKLDPHNRLGISDVDQVLEMSKSDIDWLVEGVSSGQFRKWGFFVYPTVQLIDDEGRKMPSWHDKPATDYVIKVRVTASMRHVFYTLEDYYQEMLVWTVDKYVDRIEHWSPTIEYWSKKGDIEKWEGTLRRSRARPDSPRWFFLDNFLSQTSKEDYYEAIRGVTEIQKHVLGGMIKVVGLPWDHSEMEKLIQEKYEAIWKWEQKLKEAKEVRVITFYRFGTA